MIDLRFKADPRKAASNLTKHGISFEEASSVLLGDPSAYTDFDLDHSDDETRFFTIGISRHGRFLFIVHNEEDGLIRIISARPATSSEMKNRNSKDLVSSEKGLNGTSPAPAPKPSPTAIRGKYYNRLQQGTNLVILDPALMPYFPDSASVNRALHAFLAINDQVQSTANRPRTRRRATSVPSPEFDPRVGNQTAEAVR